MPFDKTLWQLLPSRERYRVSLSEWVLLRDSCHNRSVLYYRCGLSPREHVGRQTVPVEHEAIVAGDSQ